MNFILVAGVKDIHCNYIPVTFWTQEVGGLNSRAVLGNHIVVGTLVEETIFFFQTQKHDFYDTILCTLSIPLKRQIIDDQVTFTGRLHLCYRRRSIFLLPYLSQVWWNVQASYVLTIDQATWKPLQTISGEVLSSCQILSCHSFS